MLVEVNAEDKTLQFAETSMKVPYPDPHPATMLHMSELAQTREISWDVYHG